MTQSYSELTIGATGDLHLGHLRNPANEMVKRLEKSFQRNAETSKLDILSLGGDIYDHLLSLPDASVEIIDLWIINILKTCKALDIQLWVLRGTPSHDRDQTARFVFLNETMKIGCDLIYMDELKIVWIPKFGINVLFVPDEWTDCQYKTLEEVHQLLKIQGIEKVDYAIMHGQFSYQLPPVVKAQKHSEEDYLKLVDKLIFINHVHQFSKYDRIIAPGSHDRICHGDEDPKGWVRAKIRSADDYEIEFVENIDAKIFKSTHCRGLSFEDSMLRIEEDVDDLPDGSHVRIVADVGNPILQAIPEYEKKYPTLFWTGLAKSVEDKSRLEREELLQSKQTYIPIEIKPDNVEKLILDVMLNKGFDMQVVKLAEQKLKELL